MFRHEAAAVATAADLFPKKTRSIPLGAELALLGRFRARRAFTRATTMTVTTMTATTMQNQNTWDLRPCPGLSRTVLESIQELLGEDYMARQL